MYKQIVIQKTSHSPPRCTVAALPPGLPPESCRRYEISCRHVLGTLHRPRLGHPPGPPSAPLER